MPKYYILCSYTLKKSFFFINSFFLNNVSYFFILLNNNFYIKEIKKKYSIFIEKFNLKHSTISNTKGLLLTLEEKYIIKQNKALTPIEFVSLIVSAKNNKSFFYSPLHSFIPLFLSGSVLIFLITMIAIFFRDEKINQKNWFFFLSIIGISVCLAFWFSMFWFEKKSGKHLDIIRQNIIFGFYLFIMTEALCFLALFWTFLHSTLAASIHIGVFNPGEGVVNFYISESLNINKNWNLYGYHSWGTPEFYKISSLYYLDQTLLYSSKSVKTHINLFDSGTLINPWGLPLINTLILLSSAASLNASHCFILISRYFKALVWLGITIIFGLLFVFMQFKEYKNCALNYNDGIYASCFFGITGLHGIHVILGIVALFICFINIFFKNYSSNFHQSFYFSIFYWHFVDVIWIAVWFVIYLWPGSFFFKDTYLSCYDENFFIYNLNTNYFNNIIDYNAWFNFYKIEEDVYTWKVYAIQPLYSFYNIEKFDTKTNRISQIMQFKSELSLYNFNFLMELESEYTLYLNNRLFFNFNIIKRNVLYFCVFMTEMHEEISTEVYNPMLNDVTNKTFRFYIFIFLYICEKYFLLPYFFLKIYLVFLFSPWYFRF